MMDLFGLLLSTPVSSRWFLLSLSASTAARGFPGCEVLMGRVSAPSLWIWFLTRAPTQRRETSYALEASRFFLPRIYLPDLEQFLIGRKDQVLRVEGFPLSPSYVFFFFWGVGSNYPSPQKNYWIQNNLHSNSKWQCSSEVLFLGAAMPSGYYCSIC